MTDDPFKALMDAVAELQRTQRKMQAELNRARDEQAIQAAALQKLSDDCLRYHKFQMDALSKGPVTADLPDDIAHLFRSGDDG